MTNGIRISALAIGVGLLMFSAVHRDQAATADATVVASGSTGNGPPESPHERAMRSIAANYAKWGRADENARWAPVACEPAVGADDRVAAAGRISSIDSPPAAHVRKLYLLFAKDKAGYLAVADATDGRGDRKAGPATRPTAKAADPLAEYAQVVVKEAWAPVAITAKEAKETPGDRKAHRGDVWYKAGERGDLFVMAKRADAKAAGTDNGWVYGVVTPGATPVVREVGVLRQCAECHHQAGEGRLYGVRRNR